MGTLYRVTCKICGEVFEASDGGGFHSHLLHCEWCGRERVVHQQAMGAAFRADRLVLDAWIAANVKPCPCGGRFSLDAKARCPRCGTDDWDEGNAKAEIDYD